MPENKREIDYKDFHRRCRDFLLYYEGYVRDASSPMHKIITFFSEIEEIVFGETKTKTWSY